MIRRPVFFAAISYIGAIIICFFMGKAVFFVIPFLFILSFMNSTGRKAGILIFLFFLVGVLNFFVYQQEQSRIYRYMDRNMTFDGEVKGCVERRTSKGDDYLQVKLDAGEINLFVNLYGKEKDKDEKREMILPGYKLEVKGFVEKPGERRNPGCFDYSLYLKSIGIDGTVSSPELEITEDKKTLTGRLYILKKSFLKRLSENAGDRVAGLMRGIMFGEKTEIEENTLETFQKNGTAHILAISGLHVGIIYGFMTFMWRGKKGKLFFIAVTSFMIGYSVMASFSPSVVRAVFMVELHLFSKLIHTRYDLASAAFLICILMTLKNPMALFNTGFQMSFIAVLTMAVVMPFIKKVYNGVMVGSIAVQAGLFPYIMYVFNYISLASVFVNVPIIFLTGIIVPMGLCGMFAATAGDMMSFAEPVFNVLMYVSGRLIYYLCTLLEILNGATCIDGVTTFEVTSPDEFFIALYYLVILAFLSEEGRLMIIRRRKGLIKMSVISTLLIAILFGLATRSGFEKADLIFVDVGQGDCVHIKTERGANYLIDGGGNVNYNLGEKTLKPYLLKNGVKKVEGAFVTHLHTDHYKGIKELCIEGMVDKLYLYEANRMEENRILKETGLEKGRLVYIKQGQQIKLGEEAVVSILHPEAKSDNEYEHMMEDEKNENDKSLVIQVDIKGKTVMITGDIDEELEKKLADTYGIALSSDILKVAHHGSKYSYSPEFTARVSPEYAIFQVGKNNYGHPNGKVVEKYKDTGAKIYRNDRYGAIGFLIDERKKGMEVVTVLH